MDSGFSVGWDGSFCRNLGTAWAMIPSTVCSFMLMGRVDGYGNCNCLGWESGVEEIWN